MKQATKVETSWNETFLIEANWADAASPVLIDGEHTGFQVASFRHNEHAAVQELIAEPNEVSMEDVEMIDVIILDEDERSVLRGYADRLSEEYEARGGYGSAPESLDLAAKEIEEVADADIINDSVSDDLEALIEIARGGEVDGHTARRALRAAEKITETL